MDQPNEAGDDLAPSPTEMFVASIAACAAHYAHRFLKRHHLDDHVTVRASWCFGDAPARVTVPHLDVSAPALPQELYDRCMATISRCTLKNTLDKPPPVTIDLHQVQKSDDARRAS